MRLAAVALALAGCVEPIELARGVPGEDAGTGSDAGPGDGGARDGGGCLTTDDCALGRCLDGVCVPDALCASASEACTVDGDCCNGTCEADRCAALPGCLGIRETCGADGDCCSGVCEASGDGRSRCLELGGCLPAGEICRRDADCCNVLASPACVVFDALRGIGRCAVPSGCAPAGELCDPDAPACCDDGDWPGGELDCEDVAASERVDRCMSEAAEDLCFASGETCATPEECCSLRCTPALRCA